MRKLIAYIVILSSLFLLSYNGRAQQLKIKNASVINDQGHVRISWEYNGPDELEIFRDSLEINNLSPLQTITDPVSVKSFIDKSAQAHIRSRAYKIQSKTNSSVRSDVVYTYYLTFQYDSCAQQINLTWENIEASFLVYNWTPSQFKVNINEGGIIRTEIADASSKTHSVSGILENTDYNIFIETIWQNQDSTSQSNPIKKFTLMPQSPEYINAISASADGNSTNLRFEIASNSELDTYKLLKSDSRTGSYDTLETIITTGSEIITADNNSEPGTNISYYKLVSVNECGNATTSSDIINNIVLKIETNGFDITLKWNEFKEEDLTIRYDIYRIVGNLEPELLDTRGFNSYNENIELLQNYYQFCYFIRATEDGSSASDYSQSNTVCISYEPEVYIPEAFTPNEDGKNDCFRVCGNFEVSSFNLRVYDRWGTAIFETNNFTSYTPCDECSDDSWFGKDKNGNSVPAGAYIYVLKIKLSNGQTIEKRGNITVIYP